MDSKGNHRKKKLKDNPQNGGKLSANEMTEVVNFEHIQTAHATLYQRNNPTKKCADINRISPKAAYQWLKST